MVNLLKAGRFHSKKTKQIVRWLVGAYVKVCTSALVRQDLVKYGRSFEVTVR